MRLPALLVALPALALLGPRPPSSGPKYSRLYTLKPKEGVFAYARISPDGRTLVYASEKSDARHPNGIKTAETMVDLATKKILFTEEGIDAYWSIDGTRIIYSGGPSVSIRDMRSGTIARNVAPPGLGDYYSWAQRDGKDLILTIVSNYYYLDGDKAVLPISKVKACDKIGTGERPLISKDGKRITTFVNGNIVVRGLDNCDDIFDTGIKGAKADFSWDGRYIAFHALKPQGSGYDIQIVDLQQHTVRTLPGLSGIRALSELDEGRPSLLPLRRSRLSRLHDGQQRARRSGAAASRGRRAAAASPHVGGHLPDRRATQPPRERGDDLGAVERAQPGRVHEPRPRARLLRQARTSRSPPRPIRQRGERDHAAVERVSDERAAPPVVLAGAWRSPRRETRCRRRFSSATDYSSTRSSALRASSSCGPG